MQLQSPELPGAIARRNSSSWKAARWKQASEASLWMLRCLNLRWQKDSLVGIPLSGLLVLQR